MLNRLTVATFCALLVGLFAVSTATAVSPSDREPIPPPTDYWQDKGFILMAHQGGEDVFPPNTMYAYKQAMALGADMLDMDAWVTSDGHIVLTHDQDASGRSNAPSGTLITDTPLAQLKTYDFAYNWSPKDAPGTNPFRGVATGDKAAPEGYTADDFRIPTFDELLAAFPDTPINIELKQTAGLTQAEIEDTADKMAAILAAHPGHNENVVINSFGQEMLNAIHAARPQHKSFGGSQKGTLGYIQGDPIVPTPVAVEPPDYFNFSGTWLRTVPILKPWADHDGYKIYVWGSDHDPDQDTPAFFQKLIDEGADSYNTPNPIALAAYLCTAGIAKPDGSPRCAEQVCPEGQVGIAPNDCEYAPKAKVKKLSFARVKGKTKAGKKLKLKLKVKATKGTATTVKVKLKSKNRKVKVRKYVKVRLKPGKTVKKTIKLKSSKRAKGKVKIVAKSGSAKASVNPLFKAKGHSGSNPIHNG